MKILYKGNSESYPTFINTVKHCIFVVVIKITLKTCGKILAILERMQKGMNESATAPLMI